MRNKKVLILILTFLLFFLFIVPVTNAQIYIENVTDYLYFSFNGSLNYLAANNGRNADPPQIAPSLGFSVAYSVFKNFRIEFTEDIYFANYEFNWDTMHPMACTPDNRQAFVINFATGLHATGFFPLENEIALRVFGGITADLRVVAQAFGLSVFDQEESKKQVEAIRNYFWNERRQFVASGGFGMDFPFSEKQSIGFDLRVWFPLYRLWTDEHLPAIDGWRFGAGIRLSPRKELHPPRPIRMPKPPRPPRRSPVQEENEETENEELEESENEN